MRRKTGIPLAKRSPRTRSTKSLYCLKNNIPSSQYLDFKVILL